MKFLISLLFGLCLSATAFAGNTTWTFHVPGGDQSTSVHAIGATEITVNSVQGLHWYDHLFFQVQFTNGVRSPLKKVKRGEKVNLEPFENWDCVHFFNDGLPSEPQVAQVEFNDWSPVPHAVGIAETALRFSYVKDVKLQSNVTQHFTFDVGEGTVAFQSVKGGAWVLYTYCRDGESFTELDWVGLTNPKYVRAQLPVTLKSASFYKGPGNSEPATIRLIIVQ